MMIPYKMEDRLKRAVYLLWLQAGGTITKEETKELARIQESLEES